MTLDEALGGDPDRIGDPGQALFVLRQEVRRLRAGVEAVRGLPRLSVKFRRGLDDDYSIVADESGDLCDIDDVLAALEAE